MPHIDLLYITPDIPSPDPDVEFETELDSAALLGHLSSIVGDDLAANWNVVAAAQNLDLLRAAPTLWRVTLQNDDPDCDLRQFRHRILSFADPQLQLCPPRPVRKVPEEVDSFTLPLPDSVPGILTGSEAGQRKSAAIQGILTGIIFSVFLGFLTPPASPVRRMFDLRTPTSMVPVGILCLFYWGLIYGMNRRRRLKAIASLNRPELLAAVLDGLRKLGVARLEEALRGQGDPNSVVRHSPLIRRVWITLEQWLIRPNLQNAHLVLEQQVISDREATQRSYNLLRIFVWATPVLGLIGTVVGISIAVGGFASFLSTNVDDISKIKAGLVGVTGGLSFAFLITLEGLLTSLVLMLFTSGIQTAEERLYAGIERDVTEGFLPELQRIAPEREPGAVADKADAWAEAMSDAVRRVSRAIEVAGRKIATKWDEKHEVYVADLNGVSEAVNSSALTVAAALDQAAANLGTKIGELQTALAKTERPL